MLVRDGRHGARVVRRERLAHAVRVRVLEHHQRGHGLVGVVRVAHGGADVVEVHRAVGARRHAPDAGPGDDGVTGGFVEDDVGFGLRDDLAAPRHVGHVRHEIAHRAAGHEEAGLLAGQLRGALLEGVDGGVVAEDVVAHHRLGHGPTHLWGGSRDGVRTEVDVRGHGAEDSRTTPRRVAPVPATLRVRGTRGVAAQHASLSRWRSPVRIRSGPPVRRPSSFLRRGTRGERPDTMSDAPDARRTMLASRLLVALLVGLFLLGLLGFGVAVLDANGDDGAPPPPSLPAASFPVPASAGPSAEARLLTALADTFGTSGKGPGERRLAAPSASPPGPSAAPSGAAPSDAPSPDPSGAATSVEPAETLVEQAVPVVPVTGFWSDRVGLSRRDVVGALESGRLSGYRRIVVEDGLRDAARGGARDPDPCRRPRWRHAAGPAGHPARRPGPRGGHRPRAGHAPAAPRWPQPRGQRPGACHEGLAARA